MCALKKNINLIIKRQGHTTSLSSSFCASHFICVLFSSNIAPTHHTVAFFCPIKKESVLIRPHNLVITSKPDKKKNNKNTVSKPFTTTQSPRERERGRARPLTPTRKTATTTDRHRHRRTRRASSVTIGRPEWRHVIRRARAHEHDMSRPCVCGCCFFCVSFTS